MKLKRAIKGPHQKQEGESRIRKVYQALPTTRCIGRIRKVLADKEQVFEAGFGNKAVSNDSCETEPGRNGRGHPDQESQPQ